MKQFPLYSFICDVARSRVPKGKKREGKMRAFAAIGRAKKGFRARNDEEAGAKAQQFREALFDNFLTPVNDRLECLTRKRLVVNQREGASYPVQA